jgi:ureidoglycolate lyase
MKLKAVPLTAEAFGPFGQVVSCGGGARDANQGTALRNDFLAQVKSTRPSARPNLCAIRSQPQQLPFTAKLLERHPHSSQAFLPMIASRILVIVAPNKGGKPDVDHVQAFIAAAGQGFNYSLGTWHHPLVVLDTAAELAMFVYEEGGPGDCEEFPLATPLIIEG